VTPTYGALNSYAISDSLRASLIKPARNQDIYQAALVGALHSKPANRPAEPQRSHSARRLLQNFGRKWQRSPDKVASMRRKRQLGGSSAMPDTIRHHYTEGQRAALAVVAGEVKHHGICDLPIDRIAAIAGVSRTTVQNAIREARDHGHLTIEARPRKGRKSLTNVLRIVSKEWCVWLKRGPSMARSIGFNLAHPTKSQDKNSTLHRTTRVREGAAGEALEGREGGLAGLAPPATAVCSDLIE
jgi:DNA-directed RNA polymerase specialized sigma24 family protein